MKLLQSALALCILCSSFALASEPKDKCGCNKPKPAAAPVMKPAAVPQKSAAAAPCVNPEQKAPRG